MLLIRMARRRRRADRADNCNAPREKDTRAVEGSRRSATPQGLTFEWPVPDVSGIGDFRRGTISDRDRDTINKTLPPGIDRAKLWAPLDWVIKETRPPKEIVTVLESALRALATTVQIVARRGDLTAVEFLQPHIKHLQDALRYYKLLTEREGAALRLRKFCILRAWQEASPGGQRPSIATGDNPEGEEGERRGRGEPGGPLVKYLQTTFRIILDKQLSPEGVKKFVFGIYRQHGHFQHIGALLSGDFRLRGE